MTGRQKFLLSIAYKYIPQYEIKNDRDRDVMTLRVWLSDNTLICITDVPSLIGTNKFQVRYCEQTNSYYGPSPRVTQLDKLFGKKYRTNGAKFSVVDADKIVEVLSSIKYVDKAKRSSLQENAVWATCPRDVWY